MFFGSGGFPFGGGDFGKLIKQAIKFSKNHNVSRCLTDIL